MRSFIKSVLANITAITIVFFIFFGFIIIAIIGSAIGDKDNVKIKSNSILTLDSKFRVIESETEKDLNVFDFKNQVRDVALHDVIRAIEKAQTDDNIKGISIENDNINAGITQIESIRNAIEDFKKSGKFVYSYGNSVSQPSYFLGSVADKFYLNPAGGIELKGMASEVVFLKDFADQYGIGINIIRHGKYKAAVEPFLRNDISPENKEQLSTLLSDLWGRVSNKIASSRKISIENFQSITDGLYGMIPDFSLKYGLVDKLIQKGEYELLLKQKIGIDTDKKLNKVSIRKYIKSIKDESKSSEKIAVLYASGNIINGDEVTNISDEKYIEYIRDLKDDDDIKAVILRINSPGGSANASDQILFELQQLKLKKPLIVSFGDYAASGGYYIAMAGDKIYSEPNTITGSIGVFGVIPDFKNLANKNGIRSDVVSTNANSQMMSPISGITEGTKNMLQNSVEQTYKRFVYFVTKNRNKTFEQVDEIAGGRVWSGKKAKELGLVDELGSLNDAINFAVKQSKVKNYNIVSYPSEINPLEEFFKGMDEESISTYFMKQKMGSEQYYIYETINNFKKNNSKVMMQSPVKIAF
ncbi:signal peptide peptidase SppA [Riemerella anatipestifer]|uniref:Signal peptide peptidase SppA n=1 Tax=Riemerella anatipestifer TaxID=34085 RepID=A0AAP6HFB9_RIEAN|nr:signal peptide peptidase SppA [Riemerella anatipestifer]MCW0509104.1 signal peptide peptidase SppA [Riemerella anatipestifer]MCW0517499.1 signal peptide peptidase SppA [Riemerella anatipestifer]MDW3556091.1 signal peptide peptidase SppA [Riemerella anatipestifer]MDY3364166.1 signal peptide peptidase SppA [Riemerella anatipestifer]MDY3513482.1 signal peptide peptidase SppA [Riemerella anatipestifer]